MCGADSRVGFWRALIQLANYGELRRSHGPGATDALVGTIAERLAATLPGITFTAVGRNMIEGVAADIASETIDTFVGRLRAFSDAPIAVGGGSATVTLVAGHASADTEDEAWLLDRTERALAEARRTHGMSATADASNDVEPWRGVADELEIGITRDELVMHYQPKVHVRRQQVASVEALVRWQHPVRGLVLPADFIPAAEQARMIDQLTLWTIRTVIADQRALRHAGHVLRVFVNISGQLLTDRAFVEEVCTLVRSSGASLGFEVTETSVIHDPGSAIANLKAIADTGVTIAIDDYGAGLSSLAYLKQLPASELKIDKMFVTHLASSHRDPLIVRSTIDLAHALDMEVVAEGVETHSALALLTVMGCDVVQGFLISRPIPLDELIGFLDDDTHGRQATQTRESFNRLAASWKHS